MYIYVCARGSKCRLVWFIRFGPALPTLLRVARFLLPSTEELPVPESYQYVSPPAPDASETDAGPARATLPKFLLAPPYRWV